MKKELRRVMVVDDNPDDIQIISRLLKQYHQEVKIDHAESGKAAMVKLGSKKHCIAFFDFRLPDMNGVELLESIKEMGHKTPVLMITGQGDEKAAVSAMKAGAYDYICKDELDLDLLTKTIFNVLEKKRLEEENERLQEELLLYTNNLEKMVRERTRQVEELSNFKELILSNLNDYIRVVDPEKKIIQYESLRIRETFGDGVGKTCYTFWERDKECENCISLKAIEDGTTLMKEEGVDDKKYLVTAIPLKNRDGTISAIEVISDITEKRKLEEELDRRKRLAAMGEAVAHMAHEIRNPLTVIKNGAELLEGSVNLGEDDEDCLKWIYNGVANLEELVNDILDFSRPRRLIWTETNINSLIAEVITEMASLINNEGRDIKIKMELPKEAVTCWLDITRVKSILKNLITNSIQAIKGSGEIKVLCSLKDRGNILDIKVNDDGQGIAEEDMTKLLEPFFTTKKKGTGLGMSIVKKFVEMHGGDMEIRSRPGEGTEITLTLPARKERPKGKESHLHIS